MEQVGAENMSHLSYTRINRRIQSRWHRRWCNSTFEENVSTKFAWHLLWRAYTLFPVWICAFSMTLQLRRCGKRVSRTSMAKFSVYHNSHWWRTRRRVTNLTSIEPWSVVVISVLWMYSHFCSVDRAFTATLLCFLRHPRVIIQIRQNSWCVLYPFIYFHSWSDIWYRV